MQPAPLQFNMAELENFRYRVEDILRSVAFAAVKELRNAEIKREILNSEKLSSYFAENPGDLKVLRHDKSILHPIRQHDHLKHVPDYLIPSSMRGVVTLRNKKVGKHKKRKSSAGGLMTQEQRVKHSKMNDPLLSAGVVREPEAEGEAGMGAGMEEDAEDVRRVDEEISNRVYTNTESIGTSTSGRKSWKLRHKKGQFNPKAAKANSHRQKGSFIKSKQYK